MPDGVQAVFARQMAPVQVADVGQEEHPVTLAQAVGQVDHRRLELEHVHPVRMRLLERHRLARQSRQALEEPTAGQAPALMIREPDAFHHRVAIGHFRAVRLEVPENRPVVEAHEYPADVEHDVADQALPRGVRLYGGHGVTLPVSPGPRLTDTTVALGKKLNSEALAQVLSSMARATT